jgi:hypothetical protein
MLIYDIRSDGYATVAAAPCEQGVMMCVPKHVAWQSIGPSIYRLDSELILNLHHATAMDSPL